MDTVAAAALLLVVCGLTVLALVLFGRGQRDGRHDCDGQTLDVQGPDDRDETETAA